ncbi:MAG: hypothetical protein M3552_20800 [Planctomycetota bacterium]|nr:hypothetical protein [Planctomycetota bacterium]
MATEPTNVSAEAPAKGIGLHTIIFLIIGYLAMAVDGAAQASPFPNPLFQTALSLIPILNLGLWAVRDARLAANPIPLLAQKWFVIFGWVLVPVYAIQSRGWRGLGWTILHGIGWFVTQYVAFGVTVTIVYG